MARYVVPHTMQTTIQAAKASVRSRGVEATGGMKKGFRSQQSGFRVASA
jgi:hypothetical protein